MSTEIELKLHLTPKAAKKLAAHPLLKDIPPQKQRLLNTYYDTARLELHERRIAVRFRQKGWQWLLTVKSAEPASGGLAMRSEWETQATPGDFNFSHVDNDALRHFLEDATPQLEPVFSTDFKRQIWHVPFGESLIELAIDRGSISSQGRLLPICEVELELVSGRIADIFGLTRRLQEDIHLVPAIASKAERGYKLFANTPEQAFKAKTVALTADMTPVEAFRAIALGCLEHFQRNEHGLLDNTDPEFVHQARVALRRLRSAIKLFAPVLPHEFVSAYGQTWQTLASALGEARNWDVFLSETLPPIRAAFPNDRDISRLCNQGRLRNKSIRLAITRLLAGREYPCLLVEFTAAIYSLGDTLPISIHDFALDRLASQTKRARKQGKTHHTQNSVERHEMRISFKKLRYSMEFFEPLIQKKRFTARLPALSQLQDELGQINDLITAELLVKDILGKKTSRVIQGWISGRCDLLLKTLSNTLARWLGQNSAS